MAQRFFKNYNPTVGNQTLFTFVFIMIFVIPLLPVSWHRILFSVFFTVIFFMAVVSMEKYQKLFLWGAIIAMITEWITFKYDMEIIFAISWAINIVFFIIVVFRMIIQIAGSRIVNTRVILESINGYFLLGLVYSLLVATVMIVEPGAYSFIERYPDFLDSSSHFNEYLYFGFVTFTTLGYGDIVPLSPLAKSLSILTSISGQIYIAIIIALLVGKYASQSNTD